MNRIEEATSDCIAPFDCTMPDMADISIVKASIARLSGAISVCQR
jgi:hypothetical protein